MRRPSTFLLIAVLFSLASCSPLPRDETVGSGDLLSLESLPAAYGSLESVNFAPQANGTTGWRELWFQNEATGQVTYVPVLLPDWKYNPKRVRTFERAGWQAGTEVTP